MLPSNIWLFSPCRHRAANLKLLPPSSSPSCFILCFISFNFICAQSMSSDDADFVEQPDCSLLWTPRCVTGNGCAIPVCPHAQISDTASALVEEAKSKRGQLAPAPYMPDKKWKIILCFDTSNTAQLDPEYGRYYQYQRARDWMEKSCMKMLTWQICIPCFIINNNAVCLGRNRSKDSNFEISLLLFLICPDFEVSLQSIDLCF